MRETVALAVLDAAGNRFALLDLRAARVEREPPGLAELARRACAALGVDGLLAVLTDECCDARLVVRNADGSRPEACGNGLRCVARLLGRDGTVATDAGPRRVRAGAGAGAALVSLGAPRVESERETLAVPGGAVEAAVVSVGNPHCVVVVDDVERTPLGELGPALARHPRFPAGTNVEVVAAGRDGEEVHLRVWERGVGETRSCGTGAVAAAAVALRRGLARGPVRVRARGGELVVSFDERGEAWLAGPIARIGTAFVTPEA